MNHTVIAKIQKNEFERINKLLSKKELLEATDSDGSYSEGILYIEFDDGSTLNYYLRRDVIQETNVYIYYDEVTWTDPEEKQFIIFKSTLKLEDMEFKVNGNSYFVKLNVV